MNTSDTARFRACRDEIEPLFPEWDRVRNDETLRNEFLARTDAIYARHGFTHASYLRALTSRRTPRS